METRTRIQRKAWGAVGVTAMALAVASTAYACTTFKGNLKVVGNHSTSVVGGQTVVGSNTRTMSYCDKTIFSGDKAYFKVRVKPGASAAFIKVTASPAAADQCPAGLDGPNSLPNYFGGYNAGVNPGFMFSPTASGPLPESVHNCHGKDADTPGYKTLSTTGSATAFNVTDTGNGTRNYTYTSPKVGGWHSFCIWFPAKFDAAMMNIKTPSTV